MTGKPESTPPLDPSRSPGLVSKLQAPGGRDIDLSGAPRLRRTPAPACRGAKKRRPLRDAVEGPTLQSKSAPARAGAREEPQ